MKEKIYQVDIHTARQRHTHMVLDRNTQIPTHTQRDMDTHC